MWVSLKQNVDTTLPGGRLTFQRLGAVAEFEREMLKERVKAGRLQVRRAGKHVGRPARRKFQTAEVERMRLLRSQGASVRKLASEFGTTQWMAARLTEGRGHERATVGEGWAGPTRLPPLALTQDNTPIPLQQDPKVEKTGLGYVVFKQTRGSVWTAVADAMTSYNWRPQTMDSASGIVFFRADGKWGSTWGSNNALVARFTTKKVSNWSTWESVALEANLIVKTLEPQRTEVRISAKFVGCNGWQAAFNRYRNCKWESLETNGKLEQELFERISSKLTELSQSELYPATKPDDKVISAARDQVILFEKIVAAFQLNAPTDRIMAELVDAKASLQTFTDSQESLVLPNFATALNKAAQQFATALNAKSDDRAAALKTAMDSFTEGKKCFSNYQKFVQEVEPHIAGRLPSAPTETSTVRVNRSSAIAQEQESTKPVVSGPNGVSDAGILVRTLGIQAVEWDKGGEGGAQITEVAPDSAAKLAGLHLGDVIRSLDGKMVRTPLELAAELAKHSPGSRVRVGLIFHTSAMGWVSSETLVTLQQNR